MKQIDLFLILLICPSLYGMSLSTTSSSLPLTKETTWLVHQTKIFPKDGIMIAGRAGLLALSINNKNEFLALSREQMRNKEILGFSALRNTLHWSANALVYPHEISHENELYSVGDLRDTHIYGIIEPLEAFTGKMLRGNAQDIFHLGGHRLSPQSIILVPDSDLSYETYQGTFAGKIIRYSGSLRTAAENVLAGKRAPLLCPAIEGTTASDTHWRDLEQPFLLNGVVHTSRKVSQLLGVDHTYHYVLPLSEIQKECSEVLATIENMLGLNAFREELAASLLKGDRCLGCPTDSAKKGISACSSCHTALYCSRSCQQNEWTAHKPACTRLKNLEKAIINEHKAYLDFFDELPYQMLKDQVLSMYSSLKSDYPTARDQKILDRYFSYLITLLDHFYSPEPLFAELRRTYKIENLEGCIRYTKMVLEKTSAIAAQFVELEPQ